MPDDNTTVAMILPSGPNSPPLIIGDPVKVKSNKTPVPSLPLTSNPRKLPIIQFHAECQPHADQIDPSFNTKSTKRKENNIKLMNDIIFNPPPTCSRENINDVVNAPIHGRLFKLIT